MLFIDPRTGVAGKTESEDSVDRLVNWRFVG